MGQQWVFMDCQMPIMDGFTATQNIRNEEKLKHTTIIALTANAMNGDKDRCLKVGMDDYLSKPININDLDLILEKWFTKVKIDKSA